MSVAIGDRIRCSMGIPGEMALCVAAITKRILNIFFNLVGIIVSVALLNREMFFHSFVVFIKNVNHLIYRNFFVGGISLIVNISYRIFTTFAFAKYADRIKNVNASIIPEAFQPIFVDDMYEDKSKIGGEKLPGDYYFLYSLDKKEETEKKRLVNGGDRLKCFMGVAGEVTLFSAAITKRILNIFFNLVGIIVSISLLSGASFKQSISVFFKNVIHLVYRNCIVGSIALITNISYRLFATFAFSKYADRIKDVNETFIPQAFQPVFDDDMREDDSLLGGAKCPGDYYYLYSLEEEEAIPNQTIPVTEADTAPKIEQTIPFENTTTQKTEQTIPPEGATETA